MYSLAAIPGMVALERNSQLAMPAAVNYAFFENLRVLMLFNYTVIQNFDSSEF